MTSTFSNGRGIFVAISFGIVGSALLGAVVVACSSSSEDPETQLPADAIPVGNDGSTVELTLAAVRTFSTSGRHKDWVKEAAIHDSVGPHGRVLIYFNDKYRMARTANAYPMPLGAMAVKELFTSSDAPAGFAVAIKVREGDAPETWLWWEGTEADGGTLQAFGAAAPVCENCHKGSAAMDRSSVPTVP